MATFTQDAQKAVVRATSRNPGLSDGTINLEFTYPPNRNSRGITQGENISEHLTIGGQRRKQADSWIRQVDIQWWEPTDFIPVEIFKIMRSSGNRAQNSLTYIHHRKILSQLPGIEVEFSTGLGQLIGYISKFTADFRGTDDAESVRTSMYLCRLVFKESNEIQP